MAATRAVFLTKFIVSFALIGGLGLPGIFIGAWEIVRATFPTNSDALYHASGWIESLRVMFWPSSLLIVARAQGDSVGEARDLLLAVLFNVPLYALLGLGAALACRNTLAKVLLMLAVVLLAYGVNVYWSNHIASFLIAALVILAGFAVLFRKYGSLQKPPSEPA